ncbi:MAG: UbiD family decarboxylase domain-containing protein, partial [Bilophila wadsworthia]
DETGRAVEQCACLTVDAKALAWAEYVIEGEILPNVRIAEDAQSGNGKAMPEFPGYCGPSDPQTPVMRVTAVTHRLHPIMQTTIGPSEEHVNLAGIPTEASILGLVSGPCRAACATCNAASCGGGVPMAAPVPQGHHRRRRPPAPGPLLPRPLNQACLPRGRRRGPDERRSGHTTRYQGTDTVFARRTRARPRSHAVAALRCPHPRTRGRLQGHLRPHRAFDQKERFPRAPFMEVDRKFLI